MACRHPEMRQCESDLSKIATGKTWLRFAGTAEKEASAGMGSTSIKLLVAVYAEHMQDATLALRKLLGQVGDSVEDAESDFSTTSSKITEKKTSYEREDKRYHARKSKSSSGGSSKADKSPN